MLKSFKERINKFSKIIFLNHIELFNLIKVYNDKDFKKINFKFKNKKKCCLAPYSSINFDTMGSMRVCCYNSVNILGIYPETSLIDAWNNPKRKEFIDKITNLDFPIGCLGCKKQIIQNNIDNSLFSSFDQYDSTILEDKPIVFNFDFGNICNYECIMCGGKWSSSIRKNREKLPPLKSPYDESFVHQLESFIPHIKVCNFLGGEPFLNSIYYKIWDMILLKNPNIQINITTNGSILNSNIIEYFKKIPDLNITVSLDSLKEETYNFIRKNGNLKTVLSNIETFKKYNVFTGVAFCPMIQNVYELPNIILFCVKNNVDLYINEVTSHLGGKIKGIHENEKYNKYAWIGLLDKKEEVNVKNDNLIPEVALQTLSKESLSKIITFLSNSRIDLVLNLDSPKHKSIFDKYKSFMNSLKSIHDEK
jgi:MoaA/NifB/PqqE/SkfB family radical SAM enzyme